MTAQELAPTTPVASTASKDCLYERRLSNNGSEDGTAATDEVSTPNNSDPHVLYDNDSPSFVLPEIEEDYQDEDDETNISTVSRISAAFVQFSPSIAASASADQESAENDLAHMGLSTVDAPNKPNFVQCVTSVNFLAEQEATRHHNHQNDNSPPMPIQVTVNSKLVSKRKKKIVKRQQVKIVDTPEQLAQEQLASSASGGRIEDAEEIFSVRSDPLTRRRGSNLGRNSMRRPSPNPHHKSLLTKSTSVTAPRTFPPPPPSDTNESSSSPPPLQTPKRAISMPANHMTPSSNNNIVNTINNNSNNYNSALDSQNSDGESVTSDASRSSRTSSVASGTSSASAPTTSFECRSYPPHGRTGSRQFVPNHLQPQPTTRRTASFHSSSQQQRPLPPPIPEEKVNKKEKKGMFSKLFSNQVQADFDDVQLMILQAEGARAARLQSSASLTYGVDTNSSSRGSIGGDHDPALDPGDMAQDYSASGAGSVGSFSNASIRSSVASYVSGASAVAAGEPQQYQQQQQPPPRRRIMSNHIQPDFDLSQSMSRQSSQASMSESLNSDLADRSHHSTTLSETHPGSTAVGSGGGGDSTGKKGIGKYFKRKPKECDVPA